MVSVRHLLVAASVVAIAGCQATGEEYRADVYGAGQVNRAQEVQTVDIIAISPARVAVDNSEQRASTQAVSTVVGALLGGLIGAAIEGGSPHHPPGPRTDGMVIGAVAGGALGAAGSTAATSNTALVEGVQLTFRLGSRTLNSAQVGRVCEYRLGPAIMTSTDPTSTRIQPNNPNGCPKEEPAQQQQY